MSRTDVGPALPANLLGVVGWSGSGKTTLLEHLVARLAERGLRVNVIKHSHHDIVLEPAHKDSARLRSAGAAEVMIASPYRTAVMRELRDEVEPPLAAHLERLAPADLTLVEGYKWEAMPKLEVYRPALGKPALYADDAHVIAVASDVPRPRGLAMDVDWLDLNAPDAVLSWLNNWLASHPKVSADAAVNGGYASLGE